MRNYLLKAGVSTNPYQFFGILFIASMIISGLIYSVLSPFLQFDNSLAVLAAAFGTFAGVAFVLIAIIIAVIFFYLDMLIYSKTRQIERILPEYLQAVSTNVKSGLSFEYALWYAIKPKFGVLALEMHYLLKKVMTGYELSDALDSFAVKYNSPIIRRTFNLLGGEIESGGKISHIIDTVIKNLKNNQKMKAEMAASAITYIIFIGSIVIIISPVLFALSYNLLTFITSFIAKISASSAGIADAPFKIAAGAVDLGEFRIFSIFAVVLVAFLSSMIVSIIEKGTIRSGLKYIPIFVVFALISYGLFSFVLSKLFSGIVI